MKVLMVVPWDNHGGVCRVVNQVAKHLCAAGHAVHYLLPGDTIRPVASVSRAGYPAHEMRLRRTSRDGGSLRSRVAFVVTLPFTLFALIRLIRREKIALVNVHFPVSSSIDFALLRFLGVAKVITSVHGSDLLPNGVRLASPQIGIRAVLAASDLIVAPSAAYVEAVRAAWPEVRHRAVIAIPNGVDPVELGYLPDGAAVAARPPYVLSVSQLVYFKGVDVLLRAFAALRGEFPDLRLKIIGHGAKREELTALAAALNIADRVDFLGVQSTQAVAGYLRGCTVFALPSLIESFGIAAAEAMALDRPVIASRVGGLAELIDDGVTGVLAPPGDVPALAAGLRRLLADTGLRDSLGAAAGRRVRRDFPWSNTGALYVDACVRVTGAD